MKFYDRLARELGARRSMEDRRDLRRLGDAGRTGEHRRRLPGDGLPESGGAACVALEAEDPEQVQRLYELALAHGGAAEAAPCERGGLLCGHFRDLDGNRLNAFCITRALSFGLACLHLAG